MRPEHVEGFSTAGEVLSAVLVELCDCESPVCPLPHTAAAVRALIEPADLCECTDLRCPKPHTQEAAARFVLSATGFRLWCLRHAGLPGGVRTEVRGASSSIEIRIEAYGGLVLWRRFVHLAQDVAT